MKEAAALIKIRPETPYLPAGTIKSQVERMKIGVVTQGAVGSRFTVGGLLIAGGRANPRKKTLSRHRVSHEELALVLPAVSLSALVESRRRTNRAG